MSRHTWTAALVALLAALSRTARTMEPAAEGRPVLLPVPARLPFEDYTATNSLGDGAQFYVAGGRGKVSASRGRKPSGGSQLLRFPARSKRSSPSPVAASGLEAVEDVLPRWSGLSRSDKPRFVTSKGGRGSNAAAATTSTAVRDDAKLGEAVAAANPRSNEIPAYDASRDYLYRDVTPADDFGAPPPAPRKRIIYYANLPEVTRHGPAYVTRGYPGYPLDVPKYQRDGRYDFAPGPIAVSSGDRFTYVPGGRSTYTIVDADPPGYYDAGRYGRVPAPYQPLAGGGRGYYPEGPRYREAVLRPQAGYGDGPYRDYNPRQPAPWSMQVGARLLVNDDGRPMAPRPGSPGRPFYVESQRSAYPQRFARADDVLLT
ncbi:uncharacterized protein LOC134528941 [Bacillus rossius redtenbacheri]|uniref:uncharacterized protein LOC134528941 n=1 Tax=Bacillus rossius redtenbacheri TaxID=93214 RepID=UPI002FDD0593